MFKCEFLILLHYLQMMFRYDKKFSEDEVVFEIDKYIYAMFISMFLLSNINCNNPWNMKNLNSCSELLLIQVLYYTNTTHFNGHGVV
jgi:hypothetical protein